jgi:hypothetical protein
MSHLLASLLGGVIELAQEGLVSVGGKSWIWVGLEEFWLIVVQEGKIHPLGFCHRALLTIQCVFLAQNHGPDWCPCSADDLNFANRERPAVNIGTADYRITTADL